MKKIKKKKKSKITISFRKYLSNINKNLKKYHDNGDGDVYFNEDEEDIVLGDGLKIIY